MRPAWSEAGGLATNRKTRGKNTAPTPQRPAADSGSRRRPWRLLAAIAAFFGAILFASLCFAAEPLPRSVLILNQSTSLRPWPAAIVDGIKSSSLSEPAGATSFYLEHLDLYRFDSTSYREGLRTHFGEKYRDKLKA